MFTKNNYIGGLSKKEGLRQFADLKRAWQDREEEMFLREELIPQ